MKKNNLILLLIVGLLMISCAAPVLMESPPMVSLNIENEFDKNSNFIKANEWMVSTFNDAESVIQFTDKEAGIVKGKYAIRVGKPATSYTPEIETFYAIITVRVKSNASRIEIEPTGQLYSRKIMEHEYGFTPEMFNLGANVLIEEFKVHMKKESANDNW